VLTADLVHARRRGGELRLVALDGGARVRASALARKIIDSISGEIGQTREEVVAVLAALDVELRDHRVKGALVKLALDRCEFDVGDDVDPEATRREVFLRASAARAAQDPITRFDRGAILAEVARERSVSAEAIERSLFADLRGAHRLLAFDTLSPEALVAAYEHGQAQAVLLRATKVTVDVRGSTPAVLRSLFRRLKFLRLLHSIAKTGEGYRIEIDGPFSLFESVTKYGLQLALMLPAVEECDAFTLVAEVRWGKERTPLVFRLEGGAGSLAGPLARSVLPEEVAALVRTFKSLGTAWRVTPNAKILELPGIGLTIPDLVFERGGGDAWPRETIYLEVMGYWSRAAVWRRVELVQAGLGERILFAVSSRLRVSEEVLEGDLPGALYVYKGAMSARAVAERLEVLTLRKGVANAAPVATGEGGEP
jgi:predicted nuclease of restriction endonuclease-like RecB superfamily